MKTQKKGKAKTSRQEASWGRERGAAGYEQSGVAAVFPFGIEQPAPATMHLPGTAAVDKLAAPEARHRKNLVH